MRTITKEIKLYRFDELDEAGKEKVIETERYHAYQNIDNWLPDLMADHLLYLFEEVGIKADRDDIELRYSLGHSQGDGASFIGDIEYKGYRAEVGTNHWGNRYSHWNTVDVTEMTHLETDEEAPEELYKELDDIVHEMGKKLETHGYELIEDEVDEKELTLKIQDEELEYLEDGRLYYDR